jgi:hypothetical protein
MTHFIITDKNTGKYWTGGGFYSDFLPRAQVTADLDVDTIQKWFPGREIVLKPIKWTEYVASFVRDVREHGEVGVRYYLTLLGHGYLSQGHVITRFIDCNGRSSVRSKYTLQDIKRTAKLFDEIQAAVDRGLAARKSKAA